MLIKEFGVENEKKLLFLHGAISDYLWYYPSVELLSKKWHVFLVVYDGYHEPFENYFESVESSATQVLEFCRKRDIREFDLVYGLSMGGAIGNLIYAYDKLKINTLIIDGGTVPYNAPYIITRLIMLPVIVAVAVMRISKKALRKQFPSERWLLPGEDEEKYYDDIYDYLNKLRFKTIRNSFNSSFSYNIPESLPKNDTNIYYFYGELEKKDMAWSIKAFKEIYPQAIFKEFKDTDHAELCMVKSQEFMKVIEDIIKS